MNCDTQYSKLKTIKQSEKANLLELSQIVYKAGRLALLMFSHLQSLPYDDRPLIYVEPVWSQYQ